MKRMVQRPVVATVARVAHVACLMLAMALLPMRHGFAQQTSAITPATVITVLSTDSPATIIAKAANVVPSPQQRAWQRRERIGFVHFGMNTFTDREWGEGTESPALFNPTAFDARQWVRAFKSAGVTEVVIVIKHHDGFVLYPSRYTTHSVKASPWRGGKGDVMRAIADACRDAGLALGFYLSPADRHEALKGGSFANGSAAVTTTIPTLVSGDNRHPSSVLTYQLDDYNRYFMNQMYELLTEYGPISEVWLDGAPAAGTRQPYAFAAWYDIIHRLQPNAVIFNQNIRWPGNEDGLARETEWSVIPLANDYDVQPSGDLTEADLGSRAKLVAPGVRVLAWYPAEADVSIRPGWFWHASQDDSVKSLAALMKIYDGSVGRNAVMMLNVPPDRRGLFTDVDVRRLAEFGDHVADMFETNFARGATVTAKSVTKRDPWADTRNIVDDDPRTYWRAPDGDTTATLEFELKLLSRFNGVLLGESMAVGQRVESFAVDAWEGASWREIGAATTIGYERLLRVEPTTAQRVRVRITSSRGAPSLARFGLYEELGY